MSTHKTVKKLSKRYEETLRASKEPAKQIYVPTKVAPAPKVIPYVRHSSAPGHNIM